MSDKTVMVIKVTRGAIDNNSDEEYIRQCAEKHWILGEQRRKNEMSHVDYVIVMHNQVAIGEYHLKDWNLSDPSEHDDTKHDRYHFDLEPCDETGLLNKKFDYPVPNPVTILSFDELQSKVK